MSLKIEEIEYCLPSNIEDLNQLQKDNPNWDIKKIYEKTGVKKRHIASINETTTSMAIEAANKITNFNIKKKEIEFLIFVTQNSEYQLPTSACIIQDRLGIPTTAMCFDINLGCSGFIYALAVANSFIESKLYNKGLIICSEKYSSFIDKDNRSCRPLFSDGAAAILIDNNKENKFISFDFGTDGKGYNKLIVPRVDKNINETEIKIEKNKLHMSGADVFFFSLTRVPQTIIKNLKKSNLLINDIDLFIFHQASKYVIDSLSKKLKIKDSKMFNNYNEIGNTVSSTIPIALKNAKDKNLIKNNDLIMMIGFGVGYSWGSCIIKWHEN
ncbi:ketoacyl-ACP synthase III [Pelagibacteraceae bacterium]|nr:ketoacyl-ACP synthase III [Pelagibacteraceae bacterium]